MKRYEVDMCSGPLFKKIVFFAIPLMLSGVLQLLYNAADIVVVGRYVGSVALAAVGSTSALINLIVNLFMGLSIGASVVVAQNYGAGQFQEVHKTVHTAMSVSAISGLFTSVVGIVFARLFLEWMGTPDDVLDQATLYMKIYFTGIPAAMIYNFGASILRAVGDTKRPLYFLTVSGIVNVLFNLFFVIVLKMGVAGVALATAISQVLSAVLVVICLMRMNGCYKLEIRKLHIYKEKLIHIIKIGLPAGLQGCVFSVSNVLIQSSVNSFGSTVMAGNTAASNIEGFTYMSMNSVYQACLTFTGQNVGAKKNYRIGKVLGQSLIIVIAVGLFMGGLSYLASPYLLRIYSSSSDVIAVGMKRLSFIGTTYFLCGVMEVLVGSLRGMGRSVMPMAVSVLGACGLRILWIYTFFAAWGTLEVLYASYPISWFITSVVHFICYAYVKKKSFPNKTGTDVRC